MTKSSIEKIFQEYFTFFRFAIDKSKTSLIFVGKLNRITLKLSIFMKSTITVTKEVELKTILVKAGVRYWEDSEINGENDTEDGENVPCKNGQLWSPEIDIDSGKILNWKQGVTAEIHYKVVDRCGFEIKDENGEVVLSAEDGYVPDTLCPKEKGYGDYIIMDIDENGKIEDWKFNAADFYEEE